MSSSYIYIAIIFIFTVGFVKAQTVDIEQLAKAKPFKLSGNIAADMMFSETDATLNPSFAPFQYFLKGGLTATIYDQLTIPVSFSYSNRKFDARYPSNQQNFNRFGISPKYKWVTAHAGWSNMRFSKYSLNGHSFVGGGLELSPDDYEIKLMHGRLLKAVTPNGATLSTGNKPVFKRRGSGVSVLRKNKGNKYGISFFRSDDEYASVLGGLDSLGISPEENLIVSLDLSQKVNDFINFSINYSRSNITNDSRIGDNPDNFYNDHISIYKNISTEQYNALKSNIDFKLKKVNIGLGYEKVDPGYRSHGAYFYTNDFENFTVNFASPLFKNKLNLSTSLGLEHDNLDNSKANTANRVVSNANLSWTVTDKLQLNSNYSNFKSVSEFNPYASLPTTNPYDNVDSLRFAQVSENTSLNLTYNTKTETKGHSFMVMLSMMQTDAELGGSTQNTGADYYNSTVSYNLNFIPQNISTTLSCNYNQMIGEEQQYGMLGPTLGINTQLFKKINSGLMYTWNANIGKESTAGNIQRLQYMASYVLKKKHNFNFSVAWINKGMQNTGQQNDRINNFLARLGYSYSFNKK